MVTTLMEPSEKYCFPCSNTSRPIYYKEERAVKEWEVTSSSAVSQGLHKASSICTFYHPCPSLDAALQEPSPQGNKTKITAESMSWKQLTWHSGELCWGESHQKTLMESSVPGIQADPVKPLTQHQVPFPCAEAV